MDDEEKSRSATEGSEREIWPKKTLTDSEKGLIQAHLAFYVGLASGDIPPKTPAQIHFAEACRGYVEPTTPHERAFLKYFAIEVDRKSAAMRTLGRSPAWWLAEREVDDFYEVVSPLQQTLDLHREFLARHGLVYRRVLGARATSGGLRRCTRFECDGCGWPVCDSCGACGCALQPAIHTTKWSECQFERWLSANAKFIGGNSVCTYCKPGPVCRNP
ncbi:MAG: hypothetical protein Q7U75_16840, partial [Desulfobacterales bacterium]|nr:hypothetical protein [Desulfobacterales bacterium]